MSWCGMSWSQQQRRQERPMGKPSCRTSDVTIVLFGTTVKTWRFLRLSRTTAPAFLYEANKVALAAATSGTSWTGSGPFSGFHGNRRCKRRGPPCLLDWCYRKSRPGCEKHHGSAWQPVRCERSHKQLAIRCPASGIGCRSNPSLWVVAALWEPLGRGASQEERKYMPKNEIISEWSSF